MDIEQLNIDFGIADHIKFIQGTGGFPFIRVDNEKASAIISIYAAQVLSYQPANEPHNLVFLSEAAYYEAGKGVKGGVPICWPRSRAARAASTWFCPHPFLECQKNRDKPGWRLQDNAGSDGLP